MGREWMVPEKERLVQYEIRAWVRTNAQEVFEEVYSFSCVPSDFEEVLENLIEEDFKKEGSYIEDYMILHQKEVKNQ